jgi:hypothetical protein
VPMTSASATPRVLVTGTKGPLVRGLRNRWQATRARRRGGIQTPGRYEPHRGRGEQS